MTTDPLRESKVQDWEQARRSAFIQDVLSAFTRRPTDLLPFEEVRQQLRLINAQYLGLRDVPLDQIVGSVGRYRDFTRAFSPRRRSLQERWRRINGHSVLRSLRQSDRLACCGPRGCVICL